MAPVYCKQASGRLDRTGSQVRARRESRGPWPARSSPGRPGSSPRLSGRDRSTPFTRAPSASLDRVPHQHTGAMNNPARKNSRRLNVRVQLVGEVDARREPVEDLIGGDETGQANQKGIQNRDSAVGQCPCADHPGSQDISGRRPTECARGRAAKKQGPESDGERRLRAHRRRARRPGSGRFPSMRRSQGPRP